MWYALRMVPDDDLRPLVRRELIREGNRIGLDAVQIRDLIRYVEQALSPQVLTHPSFPRGAVSSWRAARKMVE